VPAAAATAAAEQQRQQQLKSTSSSKTMRMSHCSSRSCMYLNKLEQKGDQQLQ